MSPLEGLSGVVGRGIAVEGQRRRSEAEKADMRAKLSQAAKFMSSNNHSGLINLMVQNPGLRDHLSKVAEDKTGMNEAQRKQEKAQRIQTYRNALISGNPKEVIKRQIASMQQSGQDTKSLEALLNSTDEEIKDVMLSGLAVEQPAAAQAYLAANKKPEKKYSQGSGIMAGYAFDPSTGKYTIDSDFQAMLQSNAAKMAAKEKLGAKDVAGINDKVTALTKDVLAIHGAAKSLEGLKELSTPAAKVAAVFKFMKALDPTSTVRESELGMVYSAEGAAQGLANQINKLLGEGAISEAGFDDIINTSRNMANSAIESSRTAVSDYLSVIEDNLTPKQLQRMNARVPDMFEVQGGEDEQPGAELPPTNAQGWPLMTDAQGNQAYVGPNNEVEEVQSGI
ncbi:MAG: hypothetical protein V3V40_06540 [Nitrosomonadaceae bacterium]